MNKLVKTKELYDCTTEYLTPLFSESEYPWDMLPRIKDYILALIEKGIPGYKKIADGVLVGENAFIRGSVITGKNCVIGNSSELKNCILLEKVQVPHYNYVGDSVLGNKAHMGAGSICSNLKSDGKAVVVHGDSDYETGLRKIGGILADGADIGCGCVLNPGTVIGKDTSVYPLNSLRGVFPAGCIVKSMDNIVKRK